MPLLGHLQIGEYEPQAARATALRLDDCRQLLHRLLHVTVHDEVIVPRPQRDLLPGACQPAPDLGVGVGAPLTQPLVELLQGRRSRLSPHKRLFAAPDGPETTNRLPSRLSTGRAPLPRRARYSRFCTCSRIFSIRPFAASAAWLTSRSSAFEAIVLTSRFSSWIRKSSGRPTAPPLSRTRANCSRCARSRVSSSRTSVLSAQIATSPRIRPSSIDASPRSARIRSRSRSSRRVTALGP